MQQQPQKVSTDMGPPSFLPSQLQQDNSFMLFSMNEVQWEETKRQVREP